MSLLLSRRAVLAGLLSSATLPVLADAPLVSLRPLARLGSGAVALKSSDTSVAASGLSGVAAFVVADAKTGQVLESRGANAQLPPASVAKAVTALYALETLTPGYRFETRVMMMGKFTNGIVRGDLILVGGGDPTLNTDNLGDLAASLKAAGVREVRGAFRVYDGALPKIKQIDPSQPEHVGYNPAIGGLNLNYNRVHFEWKRAGASYGVTMEARAKRYRPSVTMAKMRIADRSLPVYTYAAKAGRDEWTVARSALGSGGARWLPVRIPALYAGEVFQTLARSHGIVLSTPKVVGNLGTATVLARHQSAPLSTIVRDMLKFSTNLTAEVLGLTATIARKGRASDLVGSAKEMSRWAQARMGGVGTLCDHSGLSDKSKVTAQGLAAFMVTAAKSNALRPLMKDIPMRDENRKVVANHPINVQAKTGTLNFVSTLSGYLTAPDGSELVFTILSADVTRRAAIAKADRERPQGARTWARHSRRLQQELLQGWGQLYGS